jgi:hypothetical protein
MKRFFSVLAVLFVFGLGTSLACQDCFSQGAKLPGGPSTGNAPWTMCYSYSGGFYEICTVKADDSGCNTSDTDPTACPESTGGSGGTGGGGEDDCQREASGMCPAQCMSCPPLF